MSGGQQFNLRWNNHTNNILQVFLEHLSNENLVDVTVSCQGQFLKAHKMVLSACSPYFQEIFKQHQVQHPVIIMNGMKFMDIKLIVEFMYRGEIKVLETELDGLLATAETLQVKGLSNVRNKYEKGDFQNPDSQPKQQHTPQQNDTSEQNEKKETASQNTGMLSSRKRRKLSETIESDENGRHGSGQTTKEFKSPTSKINEVSSVQSSSKQNMPFVQVTMNDYMDDDDDLPTTIKVEPPDIRDIDEEEPTGWESPKLVIDLPEANEQPKVNSVPRKPGRPSKKNKIIGSPSEYGKARYLLEFPSAAGSSKDVLLPQLMASREKRANAWHKRRATKIPRPPNAFMIFANEWRRKLAFQYPSESNKEISVRLGIMWKNLSADTKEGYYTASRQADEEHKRKYPGYYYSPKEARMNKLHKHNLALARRGSKAVETMSFNPEDPVHLVKVFMGEVNEASTYLMVSDDVEQPVEKNKNNESGKQATTENEVCQAEDTNAASSNKPVQEKVNHNPAIPQVLKAESLTSSVNNESNDMSTKENKAEVSSDSDGKKTGQLD